MSGCLKTCAAAIMEFSKERIVGGNHDQTVNLGVSAPEEYTLIMYALCPTPGLIGLGSYVMRLQGSDKLTTKDER